MDREDTVFYKKELDKNRVVFCALIDDIIEVIEKDGLPYNSKSSMINISHSTGIAVSSNNTGNTAQNVSTNVSDFMKYYPNAVVEIEKSSAYSDDEKSEIKDMLAEILECMEQNRQPGKSLGRLITKYSLQATSIGANFATIFGFIDSYMS